MIHFYLLVGGVASEHRLVVVLEQNVRLVVVSDPKLLVLLFVGSAGRVPHPRAVSVVGIAEVNWFSNGVKDALWIIYKNMNLRKLYFSFL